MTILEVESKVIQSSLHLCVTNGAKNKVQQIMSLCKQRVSKEFKQTVPSIYYEAVVALKYSQNSSKTLSQNYHYIKMFNNQVFTSKGIKFRRNKVAIRPSTK